MGAKMVCCLLTPGTGDGFSNRIRVYVRLFYMEILGPGTCLPVLIGTPVTALFVATYNYQTPPAAVSRCLSLWTVLTVSVLCLCRSC